MLQMETLAQVGVQLLLFGLGLEFDLARVKAVQGVALLGGVMEIIIFTSLGGLSASVAGWSIPSGTHGCQLTTGWAWSEFPLNLSQACLLGPWLPCHPHPLLSSAWRNHRPATPCAVRS